VGVDVLQAGDGAVVRSAVSWLQPLLLSCCLRPESLFPRRQLSCICSACSRSDRSRFRVDTPPAPAPPAPPVSLHGRRHRPPDDVIVTSSPDFYFRSWLDVVSWTEANQSVTLHRCKIMQHIWSDLRYQTSTKNSATPWWVYRSGTINSGSSPQNLGVL